MIVNRESWHYFLWYFTHIFTGFDPPKQTNLCQYVGRIALLTIPATLVFLLMATLFVFVYTVANIFHLVAWNGLWRIGENGKGEVFRKIPRISLGGRQIGGPPTALALYTIVAFIYLSYIKPELMLSGIYYASAVVATVVAIVCAVIAARFAAKHGKNKVAGTGGWQIIKAYLKAKREKYCSIIEFE